MELVKHFGTVRKMLEQILDFGFFSFFLPEGVKEVYDVEND